MTEYELFSEILRILGQTEDRTFRSLERSQLVPREVKDVISALRKAKETFDSQWPPFVSRSDYTPVHVKRESHNPEIEIDDHGWEPDTTLKWLKLEMLLTGIVGKGVSNVRVIEMFRVAGLKTRARAKDGRTNILSFIKTELDRLSDRERKRVVQIVLSNFKESQTLGWMNVIKSGHD
jgi:hypothetical protein